MKQAPAAETPDVARPAVLKVVNRMQKWWYKIRFTVKSVTFPIICLQFVRTLILPNPLDVFILFALFLFYLGFLFDVY